MSVDLPGAASQGAVAWQQPVDIGCGRDVSVFVSVSFPLAHPTDTLCPLVYILYENPNHEALNPKPFTPEPVWFRVVVFVFQTLVHMRIHVTS